MNGETRCWQYFGKDLRRWLSRIQFILLQMDRLQVTSVYCNRRCVKTTPQMTRLRDVQQAIIMATVWIDGDKIKSDYNIKKKTWNCVCVVKPNDETSDTNDDVTTKTNTVHMKRDTWQVSVHVVCLLVRVVVIFTHCTPHRVAQGSSCARVSSHPCMKWASLFDFELSIPSNFLFSLITFDFPQLLLLCYFHEVSGNTAYSANKEVGSTDESYLPTGYEPKDYFLTETYVESLTESLIEQRFPEQRFLEDVDYDDAAIGEMLYNAYREQVYHSQREGLSVCWSVVVVRVRKNGETRCWENRETCCGKRSGVKHWTRTD